MRLKFTNAPLVGDKDERLMMKTPDIREQAPWKARFRLPMVLYGIIPDDDPDHALVATNQTGVFQLYLLDLAGGALKKLTDRPAGIMRGTLSRDGRYLYYLDDKQGNEIGHVVRVPVAGGDPVDLTPDLPPYAFAGISDYDDRIALLAAAGGEFVLYLIGADGQGGLTAPERKWQSSVLAGGPVLSPDGRLIALHSTERSRTMSYSLLVLDSETGAVVGELVDEGASIEGAGSRGVGVFSPLPGDARLLAATNRTGFTRPVIWNPLTGERQDIPLEQLEGDVAVWDWSPDGEQILLCQINRAQLQIYIYTLATESLFKVPAGDVGWGSPWGGQFTRDGDLLLTISSATQPHQLVLLDSQSGQVKRTLVGPEQTLPARPWRSVEFTSSRGGQIQAWVATPEGDGPFPAVIHVHGGPTSAQLNDFDAECQAWLDHGVAWISVNYRGSTTFGKEFQNAILGNLGDLEVDDIVAARKWLIDNGVARPDSIFVSGGSYGGYLTLQSLGRRPDLWAGGMAGVAIADWFLMYEDQSQLLRSYQVALFGGGPEEKKEAYAAGSPITYAEQIQAPILVIQGRNDTRCPERQMRVYEEKLRALGKDIQVHWFDAGHGSMQNEERIQHQEMMLEFAHRVLAARS